MDKNKVIISFTVISVILIISFFILLNNRFSITEVEENKIYKLDHWTGKVWLLDHEFQYQVEDFQKNEDENQVQSSIEKAINAVKFARNYSSKSNDLVIKESTNDLKGDLNINGWRGEKIDEQTYLVWYELIQNGIKKTIPFEYNQEASIVRRVRDDEVLESKYEELLD